jgi:hypothetical protein
MANNLRTFNSFSGVDIQAVFDNTIFGELQMVSYKIDREKAPVYTMGSPDLRTIARGKRLVSGACVFVVFDRDSLMDAMANTDSAQVALNNTDTANLGKNASAIFRAGGTPNNFGTIANTSTIAGLAAAGNQLKTANPNSAYLGDQLLAFDITLIGANEYGATTTMVIHGVELMSEASGVSIDDLVIEKQFSFIARRITNWTTGTPITSSAVDKLTKLS